MPLRPDYLTKPFADIGDKNTIPDAPPAESEGKASLTEGFPDILSKSLTAGGLPPKRDDFNGILNWLSQFTVWNQAGGGALWNVLVDAYQIGSIVFGSDGVEYEATSINGADTSTVDPVGDTTGTWLFANRGVIGATVILDIEPGSTWLTQMGILEKDGSSLLDADYPGLLAFYGSGGSPKPFGNIDATHFYLPDDRGRIMRQWDNGAGVDPDAATRTDRGDGTTGDNVGTNQDGGIESHSHEVPRSASIATGGDVARGDGASTGNAVPGTATTGGDETRMINTNKYIGVVAL